eukprot:jgi/Chrzof1/11154/Cz05g25250.t1
MALRLLSKSACGVSMGVASLTDPDKAHFGGQGATLDVCTPHSVLAGVFDGVGGASFDNPEQVAVYARKLAQGVAGWLKQNLPTCGPEKLKGDSGAIHVRRGEAPEVMTCEGQNKGWNHPLQLGVDNDGRPYGASIHRTEMRFVDVQPGDVIVLATAGILDNLFPQAVQDVILGGLDCGDSANNIAAAVVARAQAACSDNSTHVTPWALAMKAHLATQPRCSLEDWQVDCYTRRKFPTGGKWMT